VKGGREQRGKGREMIVSVMTPALTEVRAKGTNCCHTVDTPALTQVCAERNQILDIAIQRTRTELWRTCV
jgi:hypothetical protein